MVCDANGSATLLPGHLGDDFEYVAADDVRLKGHSVGIDDVLEAHLAGLAPEEILASLPGLSVAQLVATIALEAEGSR